MKIIVPSIDLYRARILLQAVGIDLRPIKDLHGQRVPFTQWSPAITGFLLLPDQTYAIKLELTPEHAATISSIIEPIWVEGCVDQHEQPIPPPTWTYQTLNSEGQQQQQALINSETAEVTWIDLTYTQTL